MLHRLTTDRKKTLIFFGIFCAYATLFFAQKINLAAVDLGRHLMNGRIILETGNVFSTNYYSFTHPNFPAENHHWLYGVVSHLFQQVTGWSGLIALNVFLTVGAIVLAMSHGFSNIVGRKKLSEKIARNYTLICAVLALPLIASRVEVRPEQYSLFALSITALLMDKIFTASQSHKRIIVIAITVLVLQQIIWVNMHLFFILTFAVLASYATKSFITRFVAIPITANKKNSNTYHLRLLVLVGLGLLSASLLNPQLLQGLLQPFSIFSEYGYDVVENQGIWFMLKRFASPREFYVVFFLILNACLALAQMWLLKKNKSFLPSFIQELFLFIIFAAAAMKIMRLYSFLGIVMVPITIIWLARLNPYLQKSLKKLSTPRTASIISPIAFGLIAILLSSKLFFPRMSTVGFGLTPNVERSAQFFLENDLPGTVFNNYDIGSYLIYELYPTHSVFVDNRPEAYPVDFFTKEYIPAQQDTQRWLEIVEKYGIQTIFFYHSDLTNWSQEFLIARYRDPEWVPIYVDSYAIIFIKNNSENSQLIESYAIPDEFFRVSENNITN